MTIIKYEQPISNKIIIRYIKRYIIVKLLRYIDVLLKRRFFVLPVYIIQICETYYDNLVAFRSYVIISCSYVYLRFTESATIMATHIL